MKRQYIFGLVSGIAISGVLAFNATQTNTTIESCAQLLPSGETFELEINGIIDTNGQNPFFSGNFSLSDGTEIDYTDAQRENILPFTNCVKNLLK